MSIPKVQHQMIGQHDAKKRVLRFCATGLLITLLHAFIVWVMVSVFLYSPPLGNSEEDFQILAKYPDSTR